ncbi:hypothetical protein LPTSP1_07760 [Leptospira johnsonii]|uniref:Uncharacterized protein n=1 Tax=Leptospira johnsonii TaxID=1917820 RepID=A0A2P2CZH8_9LEPT|nr:hypothetical protein LPTSP1_07760 [Leptospira johnsonii]
MRGDFSLRENQAASGNASASVLSQRPIGSEKTTVFDESVTERSNEIIDEIKTIG